MRQAHAHAGVAVQRSPHISHIPSTAFPRRPRTCVTVPLNVDDNIRTFLGRNIHSPVISAHRTKQMYTPARATRLLYPPAALLSIRCPWKPGFRVCGSRLPCVRAFHRAGQKAFCMGSSSTPFRSSSKWRYAAGNAGVSYPGNRFTCFFTVSPGCTKSSRCNGHSAMMPPPP